MSPHGIRATERVPLPSSTTTTLDDDTELPEEENPPVVYRGISIGRLIAETLALIVGVSVVFLFAGHMGTLIVDYTLDFFAIEDIPAWLALCLAAGTWLWIIGVLGLVIHWGCPAAAAAGRRAAAARAQARSRR